MTTVTLRAVHLSSLALASPVEAGALEYRNNSLYYTNLAVRRTVAQVEEVIDAGVTVGNTAVETTVYTVPHGADYLRVGKQEEVLLWGVVSSVLGAGANTLTARVKYAGTTIGTFVMPELNRSAVDFEMHYLMTVRAVGAGTTSIQIHANMDIEGTLSDPIVNTLATGLDSTTPQATTITLQWSDADAGNTITITQSRTLCMDDN